MQPQPIINMLLAICLIGLCANTWPFLEAETGALMGRVPERVWGSATSTGAMSQRAGEEKFSRFEISIVDENYEITGKSASELRTQMDRRVLENDPQANHDAYTIWQIKWEYLYTLFNEQCTMDSVVVDVKVNHLSPRWLLPQNVSSELVNRWDAYLRALAVHEAGHKQFGVRAGREVLVALQSLPAFQTCADLEEFADRLGKQILQKYRVREIRYDKITKHGATQGARFP